MKLEATIEVGETLAAHATHRVILLDLKKNRGTRAPKGRGAAAFHQCG